VVQVIEKSSRICNRSRGADPTDAPRKADRHHRPGNLSQSSAGAEHEEFARPDGKRRLTNRKTAICNRADCPDGTEGQCTSDHSSDHRGQQYLATLKLPLAAPGGQEEHHWTDLLALLAFCFLIPHREFLISIPRIDISIKSRDSDDASLSMQLKYRPRNLINQIFLKENNFRMAGQCLFGLQ
jgi:hypothetical protein